ncbi:MAG: amino acid ABC transporter permease [Pseudolabrys sp.]
MDLAIDNAAFILRSFTLNLLLAAIAIPIALPIAALFAFGRMSQNKPIYYLVTVYVNVLRSMPLIMVMFWLYFLAPIVLGRQTSAFNAALLALAVFEIAYFTEIIRAGIQSIPVGQKYAALSSGMRPWQVATRVILPQAIRRMLPSLTTQSIIALQDTTLASVIGVLEISAAATVLNSREGNPALFYSLIAVIYFIVCYCLSLTVRCLERRPI